MSEATDKALEKLLGGLDGALGQVTETLTKYAPDAAALALKAVQVQGIGHLALGALMLLTAGVLGKMYLGRLWAWAKNTSYDSDGASYAGAVVGTAALVIGGIVGILPLLSIYNWAAAFDPLLALAYRIVSSIGG